MLQLLVWAVCVLIIGVAYCGRFLEKIASKKENTAGVGDFFPVVLGFFALIVFILSFVMARRAGF